MNLAVFRESAIDEDAVRILVEAILGLPTEPVYPARIPARGVEALFKTLPAVYTHLHYRTDAEALAVMLDSNHKPVHEPAHGRDGAADAGCRKCRAQRLLDQLGEQVRPVIHREALLKTAVGLAVPAIEAWYCCGLDPQVTEANWRRGLHRNKDPYAKATLKARIYGSERLSVEAQRDIALEHARRLAADLSRLAEDFPGGFGTFAAEVLAWKR